MGMALLRVRLTPELVSDVICLAMNLECNSQSRGLRCRLIANLYFIVRYHSCVALDL